MNEQQQRFVDEYLANDFNATEAAKVAGYSEKSAYSQGNRLLKKAEVRKAIEKAQLKLSEKCSIKSEKVINELKKIGFSDIRKVLTWVSEKVIDYDEHGYKVELGKKTEINLIDAKDIPDEVAACIQEISQTPNGVKIKLYDKQKALELIGRHLGMWIEKHEHSGPDGKPLQIQPVDPRLIVQEASKLLAAEGDDDFE